VKRTWKPTVAGILNLFSGIFAFISFVGLIIGSIVTSNPAVFQGNIPPVNVSLICLILAVPYLAICALCIVGGIYDLQRKKWTLALIGSVVAIFSTWIVGILSTVFTALSREEFES